MYRHLAILDFEANCEEEGKHGAETIRNEIIEFPVLVYSLESQAVETNKTFHYYCRPRSNITAFCTKLTGITREMLASSLPFSNVLDLFRVWLKQNDMNSANTLFLTCGDRDFDHFLPETCKALGLEIPKILTKWCNVKDIFTRFYRIKAKSLPNMLHTLRLPWIGREHSGIDDCWNIVNVVHHMVLNGVSFTHDSLYLCLRTLGESQGQRQRQYPMRQYAMQYAIQYPIPYALPHPMPHPVSYPNAPSNLGLAEVFTKT